MKIYLSKYKCLFNLMMAGGILVLAILSFVHLAWFKNFLNGVLPFKILISKYAYAPEVVSIFLIVIGLAFLMNSLLALGKLSQPQIIIDETGVTDLTNKASKKFGKIYWQDVTKIDQPWAIEDILNSQDILLNRTRKRIVLYIDNGAKYLEGFPGYCRWFYQLLIEKCNYQLRHEIRFYSLNAKPLDVIKYIYSNKLVKVR